jgi:hypothetical protein
LSAVSQAAMVSRFQVGRQRLDGPGDTGHLPVAAVELQAR